jgi:UbiD family decarboxylase
MMNTTASSLRAAQASRVDLEAFRLCQFVELLQQNGELDVCADPIDLVDVAARLEGNPKAVLFQKVGPEHASLVGNILGSRRRLAMAMGVTEKDLRAEVTRRLKKPIEPVEIPSNQAPVHEVVWTGKDADFTRLPIHLQHGLDGGPYISASIDVSQSKDRAKRNIGYRRMMIRGRQEAGIDLIAPSDLRAVYASYVALEQRMPIAFVIGSHPADSIAAVSMLSVPDELEIMGALRSAPVPIVRCATIDAMVPADAELILEGYLDERGWREPEGPYGEYVGYYGQMKINPVFHLTAITMRRDALFQTATIGGRSLAYTDTSQLCALRTEIAAWSSLETAIREPVAIYCTPSCGGMYNLRLAIRQRYPGESRNAIAAVFGSLADVKHVFVVDDDIDIFSDGQMDWALATRFQAHRDMIIDQGFRVIPLDPSLLGERVGSKAGFDLTLPFGWKRETEFTVPVPPTLGTLANLSVREALEAGPRTFRDLMEATGSRDGRDVVVALDEVRQQDALDRLPDGRYALKRARSG